jgi:hypothetical protein
MKCVVEALRGKKRTKNDKCIDIIEKCKCQNKGVLPRWKVKHSKIKFIPLQQAFHQHNKEAH